MILRSLFNDSVEPRDVNLEPFRLVGIVDLQSTYFEILPLRRNLDSSDSFGQSGPSVT